MTVEKKISFLDFLFLHIIRKSAPLKASSSYAATVRQLAASSIIFCTDDDMLAEPLARAIIGRLFITTAKQGMSRSAFFGVTEKTLNPRCFIRNTNATARAVLVISVDIRTSQAVFPVFMSLTAAISTSETISEIIHAVL